MPNILIFTVGDKLHGMGHVQRQIVLARELARRGIEAKFETLQNTPGYSRIQDAGFRVMSVPDGMQYDICITDVEHGPELSWLQSIQGRFRRIIIVGGVGFAQTNGHDALAKLCDLQIYQGELFDHPSSDTALNGPEYLIIDPAYARCQPNYKGHIVVSFGGADPHMLTGRALEAVTGLGRDVYGVIGPACEWEGWYSPNVEIIRSPESLAPYLDGAAICVTATGMTAYESLCAGVPVVLTNWSEAHARTAQELDGLGMASNLGIWSEFDGDSLIGRVNHWLMDHGSWGYASRPSKLLIDGLGVQRVADRICALL